MPPFLFRNRVPKDDTFESVPYSKKDAGSCSINDSLNIVMGQIMFQVRSIEAKNRIFDIDYYSNDEHIRVRLMFEK